MPRQSFLVLGILAFSLGCGDAPPGPLAPHNVRTFSAEDITVLSESGPLLGAVESVVVGANGQIFAFDRLAQRVEVYSESGWISSIGAPGSGPGEFSASVHSLVAMRDGIAVIDPGNARVSIVDYSGALIAEQRFSYGTHGVPIQAAVDDVNRLLVQFRRWENQDRDSIWVMSPHGDTGAVGSVAAGTSLTTSADGGAIYRVFAPETIWRPWEDGLLVGQSHEYAVRFSSATVDSVFLAAPERPALVEDSDESTIRAAYEQALLSLGFSPSDARAERSNLQIADSIPVLTAMHVARGGHVWIQRGPRPSRIFEETGSLNMRLILSSTSWDRWDSSGVRIESVTFPAGFIPFDFTEDSVVGVYLDENDVESVATIALE